MKDSSKTIQVVFYALQLQDRVTVGAVSNQGLCRLCSVANKTENLSENKFTNKKQPFVYGENNYHTISIYWKMPIIEFLFNFLYVWNCMKLYEKKFPIFENCIISIFGQPGLLFKLRSVFDGALTRSVRIEYWWSEDFRYGGCGGNFLPFQWFRHLKKRRLFSLVLF